MTADLYNLENKKVGKLELPEKIFGAKWNPDLIHQVLSAQEANSRKIVAHAKGRGEVRGGGRKPWRQKGTGRARHGSIRSPLWKGGGVTHGPLKEKNYSKKINKKMKRLAVFSALSKKLSDNELKFIDKLTVAESKTKIVAGFIKNFADKQKNSSVLLIPSPEEKNIYRASANIPRVKSASPSSLNIKDILGHKNVLIDQEALAFIQTHYQI